MIDAPLAFAFTAGLGAAVNPCGFPMLPAYMSWFVGADDVEVDRSERVLRALGSAAAVSVGFFAVFVGIGLPVNAWLSSTATVLPWLTIAMGVLVAGLGVAMLAGRSPRLALPRLDRGGSSRTFGSMALFGVSYAVASLGCTLPLFAVAVAGTTSNLVSGVAAFAAYAAGMSLVLLVLSLALALAKDGLVRWLRKAVRFVDRFAAVLLVAVGAYLVWYGIYAQSDVPAGPVAWVERWSTDAQVWLADGGTDLGVVLAVIVAAAAALAWAATRRLKGRAAP